MSSQVSYVSFRVILLHARTARSKSIGVFISIENLE